MKARIEHVRSTKRSAITMVILVVFGALLLIGVPSGAFANLPNPPLLALEGTASANGAAGALPDDWNRIYCAQPGASCATNPGAPHSSATAFVTPVTTNFGGGSKDTQDISSWGCGNNSPSKDQMSEVFAAAYDDPVSGHTMLYFGADRLDNNGDANIGFWFIQDKNFGQTCGTQNGGFTGQHTVGDLFIASQFTNGGTQPTIVIYKWVGGNNPLQVVQTEAPCPVPFTGGIDGCAIVNLSSAITVPWDTAQVPSNGFFEGGVDLNDLAFGGLNSAPPCFSSFLADTRTSQSVGSTLKNFGAGVLDSCGSIELKKHWVGSPTTNSLGIGTTAGGSDLLTGGTRVDVSSGDGTTGAVSLAHGTYHLNETLSANGVAGGYSTGDLVCTNSTGSAPSITNNHPASGQDWSVPVSAGDKIVCTYTNTLNAFNPTISTSLVPSSAAIGASVHDTATLSGAGSGAGGSVTYRYYPTQAACTADTTHVGGTSAGTVTVTNGIVPQSNTVSFANATTVYWQAVYSGDSKNNGAASDCSSEPLTITPNATSITTTLVPASPVSIGTQVHDTVSISGATSTAGGSVTYHYYATQAACTADTLHTGGTSAGTVTVTNGVVPASNNVSFSAATTVFWQAVYTGDSSNVGSVSTCGSEPMTISPSPTSITTTLVPASPVVVGTAVHDTATLSGNTANAGGTVTYRYYATQAACTADTLHSGGTLVGAVTVTNGNVPQSSDVTITTTGSVFWQAVYSGDANNGGSVSTCGSEQLQITPKAPVISTALSPASAVAVGASVHDTSTIANATTTAGGSVDYRYYATQAACTADSAGSAGTDVGSVTVTNGVVPPSANVSFATAQTVYWRAIYSGDASNQAAKSDCSSEQLAVVDANIAITPLAPTNEVGHAHTFTVTVMKNTGSGFVPAAGETVTATATASNGATITSAGGSTPLCVSGSPATATTDANGQCTITVSSSTSGKITVNGSVTISVAGVPLTRATGDGKTGDSANGVKTYVDAKIAITPLAPTNEVGHAHTFTVTVTKNDGSGGFVPAAGVTVTATATAANGATITSPGGASPLCVSGSPAAATTDVNGQCTITVNSSTGGQITVNASTTFTVGGVSLTRATGDGKTGDSANAVKSYVDSYITISPASATNNVTVTHTFTVQVLTNDGSGAGYVGSNGQTVTFTLLPGSVGSFAGSHTCTTQTIANVAGQCTVTTVSTVAGTDTVQATTTLTLGGVSMTRTTGVAAPGHANSDNAVKHWVKPSITITKNPKSQSITQGGTATFTIVVTNNGPVALSNVRITDALSPDCAKTSASIGGLTSLAPGASVTYTCSLTNVQSSFTNSATATGTPVGGGPDVTATDTAPVTVTSQPAGGTPAVGITKNAGPGQKGQTVTSGGTASWTIVVTNPGTLTLSNVSVSDPLAPNCNQSSSTITALGSMLPNASVTYNCSLGNVTASFTNVATATGTGSNGQTVTATDSAPVTVTVPPAIVPPPVTPKPPASKPAIDIVKDPKTQDFQTGGTATFNITVTNTGDVTLTDVTVSDPLSPNCNRTLGTLAVGQSKSYSCTKPNVQDGFTNVASVTGKPPTGAKVKATDHATINVAAFVPPENPAISIQKNPNHQTVTTNLKTADTTSGATNTTVKYGTATFTITVKNIGKSALHSVKVADALSPNCNRNIGNLGIGKSKTYSCTKPTVTRGFTNTAVASGLSPKGTKVTAKDSANVGVKVKTTSTAPAKFTG